MKTRFYRGDPRFLTAPRRRMRRFLWAMPAVLFAYLFVAGESGYLQVRHRAGQIAALHAEMEAIREENRRLAEEAALLESDLKTIERIARERYGMVKKNESVYMVYPHPPGGQTEGGR